MGQASLSDRAKHRRVLAGGAPASSGTLDIIFAPGSEAMVGDGRGQGQGVEQVPRTFTQGLNIGCVGRFAEKGL